VKQNYQMNDAAAMGLAVPEAVTVAMAELATDVQEGLLAMAVGTGLQVMAAMMSADVEAVCGPKGKHDPARTAVRHGSERGSVTLGGRRVPVDRPRMRAADGLSRAWWPRQGVSISGRLAHSPAKARPTR
jgi:putative transposase